MLNKKFVFCYWIWLLTLLYYYDFLPLSLLYVSFGALVFTTYHFLLFTNAHISKKLWVFFIEALFFVLNLEKHVFIQKKSIISKNDILFNIILFVIYLVYIRHHNLTFYKVYFEILKKKHYDSNESLWQHIKDYFNYLKGN